MSLHSFFSRDCHSPRLAAVTLVALAWGNLVFCGEIHDAARAGDMAKVKALLKDNPALVSSKDYDGRTPLHYAVGRGNTNVVELLLANHADTNAKDNNGATPLHFAAAEGRRDVVHFNAASMEAVARLLLANQAGPNAVDNDGRTPLQRAAQSGNEAVARMLLLNLADANAKDSSGKTALHWAAIYSDGAVAELLLEHGTDVNAKDNGSDTPLDWAQSTQFAELLRQHGGIANQPDQSALAKAIREDTNPRHALADVEKLTDQAALAKLTNANGTVVDRNVCYAAAGKIQDIDILSSKAGCDLRENGGTAAILGIPRLLARVQVPVRISLHIEEGGSQLYRSASGRVNVFGEQVHLSVIADGTTTVMHWSSKPEFPSQTYGPPGPGPMIMRERISLPPILMEFWGHKNTASWLLAHGADLGPDGNDGETALYWAAEAGSEDVVTLLLAHGLDVNAGGDSGETSLCIAVRYGNNPVVKLLLANHADVNAKCKIGALSTTPLGELMWGSRGAEPTRQAKELMKLLRQHGGHE